MDLLSLPDILHSYWAANGCAAFSSKVALHRFAQKPNILYRSDLWRHPPLDIKMLIFILHYSMKLFCVFIYMV